MVNRFSFNLCTNKRAGRRYNIKRNRREAEVKGFRNTFSCY
ncbi:hypothetical protein [Caminicella sporogenes]|nr:hypothetical protein [Caminicella sporogenes]WIF95208.1 hypothetical protein QNI18_00795 [Caminicella sporogenes]